MKRIIAIAALALLPLLMTGCGLVGIEDGEAGVKADFGKIQDNYSAAGWHFFFPAFSWIEVWNTKTQELKESSTVPSADGLISQLDVSILYRVDKESVVSVRKNIGKNYVGLVLEPYCREAIRNVVSGYPIKALYSSANRKEIGDKILAFLKEKLDGRGISVQDVLLRDVRLPDALLGSIQDKLRAEQQALQKEYELQKAKKDAEIEIAHAEGVAAANKIIAGSITENYLRYQFIVGLKDSKSQVIYVPTEANLPILEATRNK